MEGDYGTCVTAEFYQRKGSFYAYITLWRFFLLQEKGITDLESWKTAVSSQVQELARENDMLR